MFQIGLPLCYVFPLMSQHREKKTIEPYVLVSPATLFVLRIYAYLFLQLLTAIG